MKRSILVVAPYLPLPANFGGALRIFHLIRNLSEHHDVSLLAPGTPDDVEWLREMGQYCDVTLVPATSTSRQPADRRKRLQQMQSLVTGQSFIESSSFNPQMQHMINRLFQIRRIDLVQFEFPESALYQVPDGVPVVFSAHNIEHELLARIARTSTGTLKQVYNSLESRKIKRLERAIWNRSTRCVATSERDATMIRSLSSTPVDVVPNGVDLDYFTPQQFDAVEADEIVFTGAMRHQPNADGAHWFAERVLPALQRTHPEVHVSIVGADPPAFLRNLESPSINVTGEVDDIRPFLRAATVVVVPLWSGGGTRLKILEALASGRPVVSTSIGAEGLDLEDGVHLLIANSPEAFADSVAGLLNDRARAKQMADRGRELVASRYGWSGITDLLVESHDRAIQEATG